MPEAPAGELGSPRGPFVLTAVSWRLSGRAAPLPAAPGRSLRPPRQLPAVGLGPRRGQVRRPPGTAVGASGRGVAQSRPCSSRPALLWFSSEQVLHHSLGFFWFCFVGFFFAWNQPNPSTKFCMIFLPPDAGSPETQPLSSCQASAVGSRCCQNCAGGCSGASSEAWA